MEKSMQLGKISKRIIELLGDNSSFDINQPIFCGEKNIEHMKNKHPDDFHKYGHMLKEIIENPTYIAKHPKKDSIEYIKVFKTDNDYTLVAVRASGNNKLFARTMFIMSPEKVKKYHQKGAFIKY